MRKFAALLLALACSYPLTASAEVGVYHVERVGSQDRPMLLAASERGIVFIGADHEIYRGFEHTRSARDGFDQPWLWVTDMDNDRLSEVIGAGRPSFVISHQAEPLFGLTEGCDQFWVGKFSGDARQEVFCRKGDNFELYSMDGTRIYAWEGRGYRASACYIDDFNSNGRLNVACDLPGDEHLFFDFSDAPDERAGDAPNTMARSTAISAETSAAVVSGENTLRIGRTRYTLGFEDGTLTWTDANGESGSVDLPASAIYSAAGANLGDKNLLYIGGSDKVFAVDIAEAALVATIAADPRSLSRHPDIRVRTATGNRLVDSSRETIGGIINGALDEITACYTRQMSQNQYTRAGELIFQLTINSEGRVSQARRQHSTLRSSDLESCVEGVLRAQTFPEASEGDGLVMTAFEFDFVDRPR